MENKIPYRRFGTMIDCSRNAVMKVETVKKWIDITSDMGYNTVMLYMEDTYEVKNNPYFGYGRGRYSREELKEIDAYAVENGMEFIPCIQTLAHLNAIVNWPVYKDMVDCDDILRVGDERVYTLIDDMFSSLSDCITTRHINIGMDEAHMIGRGKYYDLHGDCDRTKLLVAHVHRVSKIAEKYGFTISMWSDMFFRIASKGEYYNTDFEVSDDVKKLIPENVELVYWDYYSHDKKRYDHMLKAHNKIKDNTWFAGGAWCWMGFAPYNKMSINNTKAALFGCEKHNIKDVFLTLWGDDGGECSRFATLPALFYISEMVKGNKSVKSIKEKFKKKYGISFDRFMLLDLTTKDVDVNPSKYILFNDLFNQRLDSIIKDGTSAEFKSLSKKLTLLRNDEKFGYLFNTLSELCNVVSLKADLGKEIRTAYTKKDIECLKKAIKACKQLIKSMKAFYAAYKEQWMLENKGHGFDVHDIRIGGMIARTEHCTDRLNDFVNGTIDRIEELEGEVLDYFGRGTDYVQEDVALNSFKSIFTANVLSW